MAQDGSKPPLAKKQGPNKKVPENLQGQAMDGPLTLNSAELRGAITSTIHNS